MKDIRVIFMGTPQFAVPVLTTLLELTNVLLVVSQPDRAKDRHGNLLPTSTKIVAEEHHIEVFQPEKIKLSLEKIKSLNPDLIVTCAYGQIIPGELLKLPKYGAINVHASLLPHYRGGSPIQRSIMAGDTTTGITIMYMDESMDSGDIITQDSISIGENDILDDVYYRLSQLGAKLLKDTLPQIINQPFTGRPQDITDVTYAYNIKKEEELIDFNNPCEKIHNQIRGLSSIPGAYCILSGKRLKVYRSLKTKIPSTDIPGKISSIDKTGIFVNTLDYLLKLTEIKLEGHKRCFVNDFVNGIKIEEYLGEILNKELYK